MAFYFSYTRGPRLQASHGRTGRGGRCGGPSQQILREPPRAGGRMRSLGFQTLLPDEIQSPVITSFLYPHADFNFKTFYTQLKERGFVIYPGKISQADTFRIGNIGDVHPEDFRQLIEIIRECKY